MYRILVADDEGIMLEAFKNYIQYIWGFMYRRNCQNRKSRNRDRGDFSSGYRIYGYSYAWY